jgi:MFS family permease
MTPALRAVLAIGEYRRLVAMRVLTSLALPMLMVAIGWHIYDLTHDPVDLGLVGLTLFLPQVALTLPAGHIADVIDRRLVMLCCYGLLTLDALLLAAFALSGLRHTAPIFAVMLLQACATSFLRPASQSLLPQLVPKELLPSAVAFSSSSWQMASIAGPALGGLLFTFGASVVYGLVAILMAAVALVATGLTPRPPVALVVESGVVDRLLAGVHFVRQRPILLGAISLDLFAVLFGGATALLPVFARDILAVGPWGLGLLRSAPAAGALVCGLFLAHYPLQRHAGRVMFLCVTGFGLCTILFGLSRSLSLSLFTLAALGACDMVSIFVRQTLVQINTPDEMRGRVAAVSSLFIGASNELGEFESGITAGWFGTVPAVVLGGIGTLSVVLIWSLLFPSLRKIDRLDQS